MAINLSAISKGYFFGAMAVSAIHTVHSFEKLGLDTGEQWITPLAVDGLAFFALGLQSKRYSNETNKIGLRLQIGAGAFQLAANVFAASSLGGMVLGIMIVGIYLLMEAIGPRIRTRADVEAAAKAAAKAAEILALAEKEAADRAERNAKARARRSTRKIEEKALENLVNAKPRRSARHAVATA